MLKLKKVTGGYKMDTLKNRIRFSTSLDKEVNEKLKEFSQKTMIPVSKLMDIAITRLIESGVNN